MPAHSQSISRHFGGNGNTAPTASRNFGAVACRSSTRVAAGSLTGFWRMSGHPALQQALRNPYFDGLGLPRLFVPAQA
jgi:RNA-directed DNA polymerase